MKIQSLSKVSLRMVAPLIIIGLSVSAQADKGKDLYTANCVACHGDKGDGKGPAGEAVKARDFTATKNFKKPSKADIIKTIQKGVEGTAMAGFPQFKSDELEALANYIMAFRKGK